MKVRDLNGKLHKKWPPTDCHIDKNLIAGKSNLHVKCREILVDLYPTRPLLEEVPLAGHNLTLDFYIPHLMMAIEVQGEQHFEFIPYFHGTKMGFAESQYRDEQKREWCENNGIDLVELRFDEDEETWRHKIVSHNESEN
jgi:hypothetical protein